MDKDKLEEILKKSHDDSKIKQIIEMKTEHALPKGENFSSTIFKVTLNVALENGRIAKKSFIAKKVGIDAETDEKEIPVFTNEVLIYTKILSEMDYLMEEFDDPEGPLWCKCFHCSPSDLTIIFEDLKASGFETVKRSEMQSLEHAKLVMRGLGRFHAMAKVLEVRGLISKDDYKPYPLLYEDIYIRNFNYGGIRTLVKGMKQEWGEEWSGYADKLSQLSFEEHSKRVIESGTFDDNTFKCLNHGDCWSNNMMFKHNWKGRHIELRFIDYQLPHYNSPCVDVIYFSYTSIQPNVRRLNLNSLIKLYHESLISSLDKFGYEGPKPSLEDIRTACEQLTYFGMSFYIGNTPCVQTTRTDALDVPLIFKTNGEEGFNVKVYCEDGVKEKIGEEIKTLLKFIIK